jgi:hypothetical protein
MSGGPGVLYSSSNPAIALRVSVDNMKIAAKPWESGFDNRRLYAVDPQGNPVHDSINPRPYPSQG